MGERSWQPKWSQAWGKVQRKWTHDVSSSVHGNDGERETLKYNSGYSGENSENRRKIVCSSNSFGSLSWN